MLKQINLNPNGKDMNDCYIRAIEYFFNEEYEATKKALYECKKQHNQKHVNSRANLEWYMQSKGVNRHTVLESKFTVKDLASRLRKGKYVVFTCNHVLVVDNGQYVDSYDSGKKIAKHVYYID